MLFVRKSIAHVCFDKTFAFTRAEALSRGLFAWRDVYNYANIRIKSLLSKNDPYILNQYIALPLLASSITSSNVCIYK